MDSPTFHEPILDITDFRPWQKRRDSLSFVLPITASNKWILRYFAAILPLESIRIDVLKTFLSPEMRSHIEPIYKELKLAQQNPSEDELVDLMVEHPDLIQRPIIEKGSKAMLARPAERILEFLSTTS